MHLIIRGVFLKTFITITVIIIILCVSNMCRCACHSVCVEFSGQHCRVVFIFI